jgi:hypothetical protein
MVAIRPCDTDLDQPSRASGPHVIRLSTELLWAPTRGGADPSNRSPGTRITTAESVGYLTDCWEIVFHLDDASGSATP